RAEHSSHDVADVSLEQLLGFRIEQQDDEKDSTDNGNGQQELQRVLGDELNGDEGPVRCRDERATLESDLESGGLGHRSFQFTLSERRRDLDEAPTPKSWRRALAAAAGAPRPTEARYPA